jgi:hypothetical protein
MIEVLKNGLPQRHAYDLVWRHAPAVDETGELLAFGSTSGGCGSPRMAGIPGRYPRRGCRRSRRYASPRPDIEQTQIMFSGQGTPSVRDARPLLMPRRERCPRRRDQWFESGSLQQPVCLTGAFCGYRHKRPAFAANVSLDETRERDMLASNRLAFAFFL